MIWSFWSFYYPKWPGIQNRAFSQACNKNPHWNTLCWCPAHLPHHSSACQQPPTAGIWDCLPVGFSSTFTIDGLLSFRPWPMGYRTRSPVSQLSGSVGCMAHTAFQVPWPGELRLPIVVMRLGTHLSFAPCPTLYNFLSLLLVLPVSLPNSQNKLFRWKSGLQSHCWVNPI